MNSWLCVYRSTNFHLLKTRRLKSKPPPGRTLAQVAIQIMLLKQGVLVQCKNLVEATEEIADERWLRTQSSWFAPWLEVDRRIGAVHGVEHAKKHTLECLQLSFVPNRGPRRSMPRAARSVAI